MIGLSKLLADKIDTIILDGDDCIYHPATGLHDQIKKRIVADANANEELKEFRQDWARTTRISADGNIAPRDLGWIYPLIVDHYRQKGPEELMRYVQRVYDVDYSVIAPQPEFVAAVEKLRAYGKRIVIYSNGPWGVFEGKELHLNKILRQIGFSDDAFGENDIVDLLKTDRNPEILDTYGFSQKEAAQVFLKTTNDGFDRMTDALGFEFGTRVAFLDDGIDNLAAAYEFGVWRIHVASKKEGLVVDPEFPSDNRDFAIWSHETDAQGRVFSSVGILLQKTAMLLPEPRIESRPRIKSIDKSL